MWGECLLDKGHVIKELGSKLPSTDGDQWPVSVEIAMKLWIKH